MSLRSTILAFLQQTLMRRNARRQRPFDQSERKVASCNQLCNRIEVLLDSNQHLKHRAGDYFAVDLYVELHDILLPIGPFLRLPIFALLFEKLEAGP